ncbi:MAG: hypothetical protein E7299_08080 [Lachnospiraceae bacterium]|nr:hypothetical protein [Lachnospiraceae bacterium]
MEKEQSIGRCHYCGQTQLIESEKELPDDVKDEIATGKCNCKEAKEANKNKKAREKAEVNIERMFGAVYGNTATILKKALKPIQDGEIDKITIVTSDGVRGVVTMTEKGGLKTERIETTKQSVEV